MYCLEVIKSKSFQNPPTIRDNFNRDCSFTKSRGTYIIHSGIHRSTASLCGEGIPAFDYWSKQGKDAVNGFIEATIGDYSLADCELNAIARKWPAWTFHHVNTCGTYVCSAYTGIALQTRVSAVDWRTLNDKISKL